MAAIPEGAECSPDLSHHACAERLRLLDRYEAAMKEYFRTMRVLHRRIGVTPEETYKLLREAAERTQAQANTARELLERHIAEHGCQ